jgi:hypothetical protein
MLCACLDAQSLPFPKTRALKAIKGSSGVPAGFGGRNWQLSDAPLRVSSYSLRELFWPCL